MGDNLWKVPLSDIQLGETEEQAVLKVLRSNWLTMGTVTQEFEQQFAKKMKIKHAVAVTNATAALHLACLSLGIGEGDEVIVPSLSFVATANAVLYCGAKVRFADIIGPEELTISPELIEASDYSQNKSDYCDALRWLPLPYERNTRHRLSISSCRDRRRGPCAWRQTKRSTLRHLGRYRLFQFLLQ